MLLVLVLFFDGIKLRLQSGLEILGLNKYSECASRHVKRTSGARVMIFGLNILNIPNIPKYLQLIAIICNYLQLFATMFATICN